MRHKTPLLTLILLVSNQSAAQVADTPSVIKAWLESEFVHSSLSRQQQMTEMNWFSDVSAPYRGMTLHVVSEDIATHRYEAETLARAFYQITGIRVIHEITDEDDVVKKMQVQMQTGINIYDAYVNDTDFIGTHSRYNYTVPLSKRMQNQWQSITLPSLDLDDFIGLQFAKGMDGTLYQLPTQQFANLYWYRHDWFSRPELQTRFQQEYGYPLGVPQNWSAYEDIAAFFSNSVQTIDGERIWGHMDYGHLGPSLGWRISDSWLNLAGVIDKQPEGTPAYHAQSRVGDWGIRVERCHPTGASVARGGALDSPAAIYAVEKYVSWLRNYAPPSALAETFSTSARFLAEGKIAQQVFWYTAFIPTLRNDKLMDQQGKPVWRVAPSPRGRYWQPGMRSGYQDVSGWTFLHSTPEKRQQAAWLYAQFVVSKSVSMQKFLNGFTPIRRSDLESPYLASRADEWGGLLEFYLSDARNHWTPTGLAVPDYAALSSAWWQHIGPAVNGDKTVSESMHNLAREMDRRLDRLGQNSAMSCAPRLNPAEQAHRWLSNDNAPWRERYDPERPSTLPYREAFRLWQDY